MYRLTSGLDRISLYDVIHMLGNTQLRLLNSWEEKSELRSLISKREQLRGEMDELITKGRRWTQSAVKLRELAEEVDARQAEAKSVAARARRLEVAISLKPLWIKRGKIDDQLERFINLRALDETTLPTLEDFNKKIEEHERQRDIAKGQRKQLRDEARRLGINDALIRNGKRLEALLEQVDWLQAVERLGNELAEEVKSLESRLSSEHDRLAHEWTGAGKLPPRITSDMLDQLAPQMRAIEATSQMVENARHELEIHKSGESEFRNQIESTTNSGEKHGLPKTIEAAADLVTRLRERQQLEQRVQAGQAEADSLQQQAEDLVDEQVVPIELFVFLGIVFIVGMMAVAGWWFLPKSVMGTNAGWIALGGFVMAIFAGIFKFLKESSAADRFDQCHYQIGALLDRIEATEAEQEELDNELNLSGGSVAIRLQHAERHLAELERLIPVENQHREVTEQLSSAERRMKVAEEKYAAALGNWKGKLRAMGLPDSISADGLSAMAGQCERLAELEAKIENRRDDMQRRQREFAIVSQRIVTLAEETSLRREKATSLEQLDHIRGEYHKHMSRVEQRDDIRDRAKKLRGEAVQHAHAAIGYRRRREALFQKCGVSDEVELRQLAAKLEEAEELRKKRTATTREIMAALGKHGTEADFAPYLADDQIGRLEHDWESLSSQSEDLDRALKDALQRRGALVEQQRASAADHSLANNQVELDVVEQQIKKAVAAWRDRAAVSLFLERIREEYEQHRQPETLREASQYMAQLTDGRYTRIWTPLAHDILFVDNADGQPLSVQVLSRGTREQLFVSLRLALVAAYARRGIHLPMILDDVFVNYDAGRTRTACKVLRDFAKDGHQLMVFTCHEHVWQMFKDIDVDCRRIPNRHGEIEELPEVLPEPLPEPVALLPEPLPEPVPEPEPIPEPVKVKSQPKPKPPEPELIIEEPDEVYYEEPAELPPPPRTVSEVEYWWDSPAQPTPNGVQFHEEETPDGWLPEPEIRQRW
jgi:uncharacterized protein YhaN